METLAKFRETISLFSRQHVAENTSESLLHNLYCQLSRKHFDDVNFDETSSKLEIVDFLPKT